MVPMNFTLRPAQASDAQAIARVNHVTWAETYQGLLDPAYIQSRSLDEQVKLWQDQLSAPSPSEARVLAEREGLVLGYAGGGRNPDTHSPFSAELFGIYVLRDYQRQGVGTALLHSLASWLASQGHRSMLVWIMRENPFREFYVKTGASLLEQTREIDYGGKKLTILSYGWHDIGTLL